MRLLALETSGMSGEAAVWDGRGEPYVVRCAEGQRSAQALAPAVQQALAHAGWKGTDVDLVAVAAGPGSFTGLRIGVTTAKLLAYAAQADLVAVDTLDVLARQATIAGVGTAVEATLHAIVDAHRQELFAAEFRNSGDGRWMRTTPTRLVGAAAWIAGLRSGDAATGPIVEKLAARFAVEVVLPPPAMREPSAGTVAKIAAELHAAGRRDDPWTLVPWYGRLAAAEEKRLADGLA